ncbi:hypothetical protein [Gorillibacterium timonense]|uniref:hypothetical protein n=1 Tax=Gorillibacterium timonense TaxID=1689269 RepID=UPI00071C4340|nr:hypothetical protein [Gorillibacterium timonense]
MDKRLIIGAYRQGILTREQCAQILGIESESLLGLVSGEPDRSVTPADRSAILSRNRGRAGSVRNGSIRF